MAITDVTSDIAGVGPVANFTLGLNTQAPYAGFSIVGLTDGVSAATASKNMAEIDNRMLFERRYTIELAGLTYDPLDDSQFVRALQKLPNISPASYAQFPSTDRPVNPPSVADPATIKTNTNGEVFMWNGTTWTYMGGGAVSFEGVLQATQYPMVAFTANTQILESSITTITNPSSTRAMKVSFSETNTWLDFVQSLGNVTVDFVVEVHAIGAPAFYGTYNGRAVGTPNFPAGNEQSIAAAGVLPFGSFWTVGAGSAQQFKITLRSANAGGGTVTPAAGNIPVIHLSGKYKTEFLG